MNGNRGTVKRRNAGTFDRIVVTAERVEVTLHGNRLKGRVVIEVGSIRFECGLNRKPTRKPQKQ